MACKCLRLVSSSSQTAQTVASFKPTDLCQFTPGPNGAEAVSLYLLQRPVAAMLPMKTRARGGDLHSDQPGLQWRCVPRPSIRELLQRQVVQTEPHDCRSQSSIEKQNYKLTCFDPAVNKAILPTQKNYEADFKRI